MLYQVSNGEVALQRHAAGRAPSPVLELGRPRNRLYATNPGTASTNARNRMSLAPTQTANEEDAQPVVVGLREPWPERLTCLMSRFIGFDRSGGGAGALVVENLGHPSLQQLGQPAELGS